MNNTTVIVIVCVILFGVFLLLYGIAKFKKDPTLSIILSICGALFITGIIAMSKV